MSLFLYYLLVDLTVYGRQMYRGQKRTSCTSTPPSAKGNKFGSQLNAFSVTVVHISIITRSQPISSTWESVPASVKKIHYDAIPLILLTTA